MDRRRIVRAAALDAVALLVFVTLGRRTHDEGSAITGILRVAAPFLISATVGWLVLRVWRRPEQPWEAGAPLAAVTVALGMVLRRVLFDGGTALAFVIVATAMIGATMIGWRLVAERLAARAH